MRKRCIRCNHLKVKDDFVKDKRRQDGVFPWCKECHCAYQKKYREENPEIIKSRKDAYYKENREEILSKRKLEKSSATAERQNAEGRFCPYCGIPVLGKMNRVFCSSKCNDRWERLNMYDLTPEEFKAVTASGKCPLCLCNVTKWQIDHNHATGETTGPVCSRCNQYLLAGCKHDIEIAKRLVEYLLCPPVRKMFGEKRYSAPPRTSKFHRIWAWTGKNPPAWSVK